MRFLKALLTSLVLALQLGLAPAAFAQQFAVPFEANQYMFDQINAFRVENGLPKLTAQFGVGWIADTYALWLAQRNLGGHDDDGLGPAGRMQAAKDAERHKASKKNFDYCGLYENIHRSATYPNADDWRTAIDKAMTDWKNSPGHRQNMLRANLTNMGTGIIGWKHGRDWWFTKVMVFADRSCL